MFDDLSAASIGDFHDRRLAEPWATRRNPRFADGVWHWIEMNHLCNALLWDEEEKARRCSVPASEIAKCKRLIDNHGQRRSDAVAAIDEAILTDLEPVVPLPTARLHSETAGAMIDRLSVLSLKVFHMRLQARCQDAAPGHVETCEARLARLVDERTDLGACLDRLLREASLGQAYFKVYRIGASTPGTIPVAILNSRTA